MLDGAIVKFRLIFSSMIFLVLACAGFAQAQESSSAMRDTGNTESLMNEGRALAQKGNLVGALDAFEKVLKIDENNAEALYRAGTIYLRMNQIEKGVSFIEKSVSAAPNNVRLRLILAQTYENIQAFDKALSEYREVMKKAPDTPEGAEAYKRERLLEGKKYGTEGKLEQALMAFSSVLADYPNDVPTLLDNGLTLMFMGRLDDAQADLEKALSLQPNNGVIHKYLGDIAEKKGQTDQSIEHYQRALQLAPPGSPAKKSLGIRLAFMKAAQYSANGKLKDAKAEYEKVLAIDPRNPSARFNLSKIYHDLGDLPKAEQMLESLVKDNPSDLNVKLRLGTLHVEMRKLAEASKELAEIVASGVEGPVVQQAKQVLENIRSNVDRTPTQALSNEDRIAVFKAMVDKNPDDWNAWMDLGRLYTQMGKRDDAISAMENVVRLRGNDVRALSILGGLYDDVGKYDQALTTLGKAYALEQVLARKQKLDEQMALILAKKAYTSGNMDEAEREFRDIAKVNNNDFIAHFFLALIYSRGDKLDQAEAEYKEVLRIVPGHMLAKLSLAAIHEQTGHEEEAVGEYQAVAISRAPGLSDTARDRLERLLKRMGGFSFNVGYTLNFDSNSNLSSVAPAQELRSDTSGTISYQQKVQGKRLYWGIRFTPTYSIYHQQQFDFLAMEASPFLNGVWHDYNLSARYSFTQTDGVLIQQHYNSANSVYADVTKRFKMRPLLPFLASDEQKSSLPSAWRLNGSYRTFRSTSSPIYDSDTFSFGALLNQTSVSGWSWTGVYSYTDNKNLSTFSNDFAFTSHGINLQLSKSVSPSFTVNGGYAFTYSQYTHPDSVTRFTKSRVNKFHSLFVGLNYNVNDKMRLFCSYNYQKNTSNLPTGFILSTEDVGTAIGIQSPSLGDYHKYGITAGLALNF